jgi:polysaccharide pyruvyl transferase WcaK-like protein
MGMQPSRVGISGSYGGLNLGDEAILEAMVRRLRASVPAQITVFTREAEDTLRRHDVDHAVPIRQLTRDEDRAWDIQGELRRRITDRLPQLQERARETNRIVIRVLSETHAAAVHGGA